MKATAAPRTDLCAVLKTDWKTAQSICGRHNQYHRGSQRWLPSRYIKNTFYAIHSTFRSLGMYMYSKRRYKICTCSVILGEFQPFQNHKVFNIIFPKVLDTIKLLQKWEFFWLLSPKWIQKFLGFHFCTKNSTTWAVKCEKLNFGKSRKWMERSPRNFKRSSSNREY